MYLLNVLLQTYILENRGNCISAGFDTYRCINIIINLMRTDNKKNALQFTMSKLITSR